MGLKQYSASLLMLGLFSIAILSYAISYANDNDSIVNLNEDDRMNKLQQNLTGNFQVYESDSDDSFQTYIKSKIKSGDENTEGGGQFKTSPIALLTSTQKIMQVGQEEIFGTEEDSGFGIIFTALGGFMLVILGFYGWKAWKGNPD